MWLSSELDKSYLLSNKLDTIQIKLPSLDVAARSRLIRKVDILFMVETDVQIAF